MIHCIGDSHSSVFCGKEEMQPIWPQRSDDKTEYFRSYRIGPATAYQIRGKLLTISQIIHKVVNEGDGILFCFGEVDCRAHLKKQMDLQGKSLEEIVHECVDRYFEVILEFKEAGDNIMVWGPIATWGDNKAYTGPSFGTMVERNEITKEFNDYLKELCENENIPFITLFYDMVDENLNTNTDLLDDWEDCHIHLSQRAMPLIIEKFKEQDLI
jgi:hypothetical protein